jgi:hypothetical protein
MFTVSANFIDIFKIGDNINYNLEILKLLYEKYEELGEEKNYLIKPIVILNTSITEAILYDFIENRIRRANKTEVMFPDILAILRLKRLDKFEHYIIQAEKYDFFNLKDTKFYEAMHSLRKKRNRVHIQNSKGMKPSDEDEVFTEKAKHLSEVVLEKVLETMSVKYPRRAEYHGYVQDFELPWNRHFH